MSLYRHEKSFLLGFRPGKTPTNKDRFKNKLKPCNFGYIATIKMDNFQYFSIKSYVVDVY